MKIKSTVRTLTGALLLISLGLTYVVDPWWLTLGAFVGFNAFQSAFSGFCLVGHLFYWIRPDGHHVPSRTSTRTL